jgi:hypothetical protein
MSASKQTLASPSTPGSPLASPWFWASLAILGLIAFFARTGVVSPRVANPAVTGAPRPVEYLLGWTHWTDFNQIMTVVMMLVLTIACMMAWQRRPGHPYVLMTIAATAIVWQDPVMNWAPYAVYDPRLWHWPEDWPLANLSPTVEPFVVIGYATFYFGPFFPANWTLRRLQAGRSMDSFPWRHPLISLAVLILLFGFLIDMMLEVTMIRTGLYIYSQVVPFGSIFVGTPFQFPLIWESSLVTLVMIPAGVLCYRDDTGRTQAEKLAQRLRAFRTRPALATFLVMFGILNVAYFMYGAAFAVMKAGHFSNSVACPWPYPEAKVYDPQGFYEREGQAGPYFAGKWSTWASGQPDGRPAVNELAPGGHCGAARG